jgi:hypothetical protein
VREQVIRELRAYRSAHPEISQDIPTAEKQLDSLDSAVVEVMAEIPAGAVKDQRFDIFVRADDPDVQSLVGGFLIPCDLRIYQEVSAEQGIEGRIHARALGPIFINPFTPTTNPSAAASLREGHIIGGGINQVDRRLSLVTTIESYATVRQIMDSINRRFTGETKVADANSPSHVEIKLPPEYRTRRQRFLDLIMHLPLAASPAQREARGKALLGELTKPDAQLEDVSLALEGVGSSIIPLLQPLYTDPNRNVNYFAARAGLRLGDELAIEVIIRHTGDARSPYRLPAVRELGDCTFPPRASNALRELLGNSDARIRIAAFEALRRVDRDSISRFIVGEKPQNFLLEMVPSEGPPTIYARRTELRRIAFIGGDHMVFQPPLLYSQPGQPITISAGQDDQALSIVRKNVEGRTIGPLQLPLAVVPIARFMGSDMRTGPDGRLSGLGLDYAVVLDVLYRLCNKGAINAEMRWEEPTVEELVGPLAPMERPESEL